MEFVKSLFRKLMLKISQRRFRRRRRRAFGLLLLVQDNISLCIAISDPDGVQERFNEHWGIVNKSATQKIIHPEWFDEALSEGWENKPFHDSLETLDELTANYVENRAEVDELVLDAVSNPRVMKWLRVYLQIQCYLHLDRTDKAAQKYWENRLEELDPAAKSIKAGDVENLISEAKRDIKDSRSEISDLRSRKIALNFRFAVSLVPILYTVITVAALIHSYVVFSLLGVPIYFYYSLSDYLSSGIGKVYEIAWWLFGPMLGLIFTFFGALRKPSYITKEKSDKIDREHLYVALFLTVPVVVALSFGVDLFHGPIPFFLVIIVCVISGYLAKRFFVNSDRVSMFSFMFFFLLWAINSTVNTSMDVILKGDSLPQLCEQVIIPFDNDENSPSCGSPVIGVTQAYVFIFDRDKKTTFVWSHSQKVTQGIYKLNLYEDHPLIRFSDGRRTLHPVKEIWDNYKSNKDRREAPSNQFPTRWAR